MFVWKTLRKSKIISCFFSVFLSSLISYSIERKPKKISRFFFCLLGAFPCKWFFSFFPFFNLLSLRKTQNSKNILVCFSEVLSFVLSHTKEKTTMKMLCGSHMHYCWSNKGPKLPCLLLLNKMLADSSLFHDTLVLLLFSYHSVVQVKGNNDNIWWSDCGREKRVWTQIDFVFVNMFNLVSMI